MTLKPLLNYIVCELVNDPAKTVTENGIVFKKESMPIYKVIDNSMMTLNINLNVNDQIIINSTPTKVKLDDKYYYLVNQEHIAGIIV